VETYSTDDEKSTIPSILMIMVGIAEAAEKGKMMKKTSLCIEMNIRRRE
jgi:hypothetical protein